MKSDWSKAISSFIPAGRAVLNPLQLLFHPVDHLDRIGSRLFLNSQPDRRNAVKPDNGPFLRHAVFGPADVRSLTGAFL